jgi:hypothetical protein
MRIPGVDTLGDLCDRLFVETAKLAHFENRKRDEQAKPDRDPAKIAAWDNLSRDCCEMRSMLKSRINELFAEVVASGEYQAMKEVRTFRPPAAKLSDVLADACYETSQKIAQAMQDELLP